VRFVAFKAGYLAIVLYANDELSAGEVGEGDDMLGYLVGVLARALPVKILVLPTVANTCGSLVSIG